MAHTKKTVGPSICRTCGAFEVLATATQCTHCWERTAEGAAAIAEAKRPVAVVEAAMPEAAPLSEADERWREILARQAADQGPKPFRKSGKQPQGSIGKCGPLETWFDRQAGGGGLCWFCHRRPGEDQFRGVCRTCFKGEPVSATQTSNGRADQAAPKAAAVVPAAREERIALIKGNFERSKAIRAIIERLGREATDNQIRRAAEEAGLGSVATSSIHRNRGVLWPGHKRAKGPAPKTDKIMPKRMCAASPATAAADPTPGINLATELEDLPRRLAELKQAVEAAGGECSFSLRIVGLTLKYEG